MSGRRRPRPRTTRAEIIAKLKQLATFDPTASDAQLEAQCAQLLGLPGVADIRLTLRGWARIFVEMSRVNFERTGDPLYAWKAYKACRSVGNGVPLWVDEYLRRVTFEITDPNNLRGDLGRALPRILGFRRKPGKRSKTSDPDDLNQIRLVVGFACAIMDGADPGDALLRAHEGLDAIWDMKDQRTLLAYLSKSFGLPNVPRTREQWEAEIGRWVKNITWFTAPADIRE
jgi:hypothetical protein